MSTLTILVLLFAALNTAFLVYTVILLRGLRGFKLNDETYMYQPRDHLRRGEKRQPNHR